MKTSKRYHDLVERYHFNPIQDYSLFINMETQHFFKPLQQKENNQEEKSEEEITLWILIQEERKETRE